MLYWLKPVKKHYSLVTVALKIIYYKACPVLLPGMTDEPSIRVYKVAKPSPVNIIIILLPLNNNNQTTGYSGLKRKQWLLDLKSGNNAQYPAD